MNDLKEILSKYTVKVIPLPAEDGGGYKAYYEELGSGVKGYGETKVAAVQELEEVILDTMEDEDLAAFPAALGDARWAEFSGRVTLRVPKILHAQLDRLAGQQGVSLNQLMCTVLQSAATAMGAGMEFGPVTASHPESNPG